MKKQIILVVLIMVFVSLVACFVYSSPSPKGFDVDNVLLKLSVKQNEEIPKTIKIINTDFVKQNFVIIENLDFLAINENEFNLEAGESKVLEIRFNATKEPGVYTGSIIVSNKREELKIPVILEVESKEVLFDISISIPLGYHEVSPGSNLAVENEIFNLENIGLKIVDVIYTVKDFNEKTIFSEQENIAVENQILVTKLMSIPEGVKTGDHVLIVTVKYGDSIGTSSYFFKIIEKKLELKTSRFYSLDFWVFFIILLVSVIVFIIFTKQRDKLFLELEKQHRKEFKEEMEKFEFQKKLTLSKARKAEKTELEKRLIYLKKQLEEKIKGKQKKQKNVFRKLKKLKKKSEMEKKLEQWKKEGFDAREFLEERKIKGIKQQLKKWEKQGYETSVLK